MFLLSHSVRSFRSFSAPRYGVVRLRYSAVLLSDFPSHLIFLLLLFGAHSAPSHRPPIRVFFSHPAPPPSLPLPIPTLIILPSSPTRDLVYLSTSSPSFFLLGRYLDLLCMHPHTRTIYTTLHPQNKTTFESTFARGACVLPILDTPGFRSSSRQSCAIPSSIVGYLPATTLLPGLFPCDLLFAWFLP